MAGSASQTAENSGTYAFLLDAYETEALKIAGIWLAFPADSLAFRPAPKSRTVLEQMEHQVHSEGRWMSTMLGIDAGDPDPAEKTVRGFVEQYRGDSMRRLEILRSKPDEWWRGSAQFFDVPRSRAWIFLRRLNHSTHHRGQLIVYLRILGLRVPSVYGPTADTDGRVVYQF